MTTFQIKITAECPSDWTPDKVREHLRKCFTIREFSYATIEDITLWRAEHEAAGVGD